MKNKHIALLADRYWPAIGGIEVSARLIAGGLAEDFHVEIITHKKESGEITLFNSTVGLNEFAEYHDPNEIKVLPLIPSLLGKIMLLPILSRHLPGVRRLMPRLSHDLLYAFYALAFQNKLRKMIQNADLVLCFSGGYLGILSQKVCSLGKKKLIHISSIHPGKWDDSPKLIRNYKKSDGIAVNTFYAREYLAGQGVAKEKIEIIPRPIEEMSTQNDSGFKKKLGQNGPFVLFVGRKETHKGCELLTQAFKEVVEQFPKVRLVLIGPGECGLDNSKFDWCIDLGYVSDIDKAAALKECEMLCVPSKSESLGMVYLEAWHAGKPVIACDTPETSELIDSGKNGLLIDYDAGSLADAINTLLGDPQRIEEMGRNGRKRYDESYSNKIIKKRILDLCWKHLN